MEEDTRELWRERILKREKETLSLQENSMVEGEREKKKRLFSHLTIFLMKYNAKKRIKFLFQEFVFSTRGCFWTMKNTKISFKFKMFIGSVNCLYCLGATTSFINSSFSLIWEPTLENLTLKFWFLHISESQRWPLEWERDFEAQDTVVVDRHNDLLVFLFFPSISCSLLWRYYLWV